MKRFALPLYAGFVAYLLSSAFLGPAGPASMRRLEAEKKRIQANLDDLKRLNEDLSRRITALRTDEETQALEARSLGFVREGEKVLRIPALPPRERFAVAGRILAFREGAFPGRILALPISISVFALLFLATVVLGGEGRGLMRRRRAG